MLTRIKVCSIIMLLFLIIGCTSSTYRKLDTIIINGQVYDGSLGSPTNANVGIKDGVIVAIGELKGAYADVTIDAGGKIVSPGFIDLHSHSERGILRNPDSLNILYQGVTTILGGNCGGSPANVEEYFNQFNQQGSAINVGLLIGHNTIRRKVMQRDNRHATPSELYQMRTLVEQAMKAGAFGLSSGLLYIPGTFAPPEELYELASVIKPYDGFYATHLRSEGEKVVDALDEAIQVAIQSQVPVHISHHKTAGPTAWGKSKVTLSVIDNAQLENVDITLDQYPYTASNTNLGVLLPAWSLEGGAKAFEERTQNQDIKQSIITQSANIIYNQRAGNDLNRILISEYRHNPSWEGMTFADVLSQQGQPLTSTNAAKLAVEIQLSGGGRGIYHTMQSEDVERIMKYPLTSIASDGRSTKWQEGSPHPRNYGSYPRVISKYVNEKNVLTVTEAIHKMTALPASRMGLNDRGMIKVGYKADILVWDQEELKDNSTFENPHQYSDGIEYMLVNGQLVIRDYKATGIRPGAALKNYM